ncbi:transcriptional regulator [Ornithinimicrobium humiphilum]|uniref:Transcriptional regulator n=1 Tax=Ornithinimicrobium humiphilum TaxID=125288 RepID=A0A543KLH5_9MICO|nr:transcriptional regulator [Ornithinimicrobium humiphilum]TQM95890.1 transcriptional regulator [Ornithinimicrobium humiphilum]
MSVDEAVFDELIHFPARLRICGLLRSADAVAFRQLEAALELPASQLSRHLKAMTEVGYVSITKSASPERGDARRVAWVSLTPAGRQALERHMAALTLIAQGHEVPTGQGG